jgi:hypothetical protein
VGCPNEIAGISIPQRDETDGNYNEFAAANGDKPSFR